jgi:hypothetical protein
VSLLKGLAKNKRVVRGGSFNNNRRNARCAYRNRNNPNNRNNNNGFRVGVVSHIFAGMGISPEMLCSHGCMDEVSKMAGQRPGWQSP